MPEITSAEAVRVKLREFEDRVDSAIVAAQSLARMQGEAEKLVARAESASRRCEQALLGADEVRARLLEMGRDWSELKEEMERSRTEATETCALLVSEVDSAVKSIEPSLRSAQERLESTNAASLATQAELLGRLDQNTQANAKAVESARLFVTERAEKLEQLVSVLRDELQSETESKLLRAKELLESRFAELDRRIQDNLSSTATSNERLLRAEMDAFKREMSQNLSEHQLAADRQLTEFLNKQNALVQNLTQQIESYRGVSQALLAQLATMETQVREGTLSREAMEQRFDNSLHAHQWKLNENSQRLDDTIQKLSRWSWSSKNPFRKE